MTTVKTGSSLDGMGEGCDPTLRAELADTNDPNKGAGMVGYRQTGVRAQGRDVRSRLLETASVLDYKMAADIDDTLALQALVDSHQYTSFVGPEYTFVIRGTIRLRNGNRLDLRGAKIVQLTPQAPIFDISDRDGIAIWGGELIGCKDFINSPSSQGIGVFADGSADVRIDDIIFRDFGYAGVRCQVGGEEIAITNCTVVGFADELGAEDRNNMGFCLGGTSISIRGCRVRNTSQGLIIVEKAQSVVVADNIIKDIPVEHGMYLDHSLRNVVVSNNTIRNVGHMGMKVQWYDTTGANRPENITLTGNTIYGCGDTGLAVLNTVPGIEPIYARGISITDNTIAEVGGDGIIARFVEQLQISGNSIYSVINVGLSGEALITANITGNAINKTTRNGIYIYGSHSGLTLTNNNLRDVGLAGDADPSSSVGMIVYGGSSFTIAGNNIRSDAYHMAYGISIETTDTVGSVVRDNYIRGYISAGVRLPSGTAAPLDYVGGNVSFGQASVNAVANLPAGPVQGDAQAKTYTATDVPTAGTWTQGDRVKIRYPAAGQPAEYVCVVSGEPGVWRVSSIAAP